MLGDWPTKYKPIALQQLEDEISNCADRHRRNLLRAKRASILAHSSELAAAKIELASLREENRAINPHLSAWLIYCDGQIYYSAEQDPKAAIGRFKMALIFASGLKDRELAGLSAAWVAQCHFLAGEIDQVPKYLSQAFNWSMPNQSGPLARAFLVLADTLAWAGREELARPCYHKARGYAASAGEISMQNSVIYNSAAFRVSNLGLSQIRRLEDPKQIMLAETEVISASTLNALIDNQNSPQLISLLRAELFTCLGNWEAAISEFDNYFSRGTLDSRYTPKLVAERALCQAKIGKTLDAISNLELARAGINSSCDLDDLAILHFRIYQTAQAIEDSSSVSAHLDAAEFVLTQFETLQSNITSTISPVLREIQALELQTKKDPD